MESLFFNIYYMESLYDNFLLKSKLVHNNKYDYSMVDYKNNKTKVKIICKEHGVFEQRPDNHIGGQKCPSCSLIERSIKRRNTVDEFIERSRISHGDKYDYTFVEYETNNKKVKIICPIHGDFYQTPNSHIRYGCSKCGKTNAAKKTSSNVEKFIQKSNIKHNNKYDYSLVIYKNNKTNVKIICPEHGIFEQRPDNHMSGKICLSCSIKIVSSKINRLSLSDFIERSNKIHKNEFDYSLIKEGHKFLEKVDIICRKHGIFSQTPHNHLSGQKCPKCKNSKGVRKICDILDGYNIEYEIEKKIDGCISNKGRPLRFDIYLNKNDLYIEYDGHQHFFPVWGDESFIEGKSRDNIKNEYCIKNNINLIRISYMDDIQTSIDNIIKIYNITS